VSCRCSLIEFGQEDEEEDEDEDEDETGPRAVTTLRERALHATLVVQFTAPIPPAYLETRP
jgi:hypothetical protein